MSFLFSLGDFFSLGWDCANNGFVLLVYLARRDRSMILGLWISRRRGIKPVNSRRLKKG